MSKYHDSGPTTFYSRSTTIFPLFQTTHPYKFLWIWTDSSFSALWQRRSDPRSQGLSSFRPLVAMGTKFPVPWTLFRSHVSDVTHTSQTVTRGQVQFQFFFNLPFMYLMFTTITLIIKYCSSSRFKEGEITRPVSIIFEYLKGWLQALILSAGVNYITHLSFCLFTIRI